MIPQKLKKGDNVAIVAPAKYIDKELIDNAIEVIRSYGLNPVASPFIRGEGSYFSGSLNNRKRDFEWASDNYQIKAIFCARGGYGSIQIVDQIGWGDFLTHPQWVVGYSDITVFHNHLENMGIASLHAPMPLDYPNNTKEALDSIFAALMEDEIQYEWTTDKNNVVGEGIEGKLTGGSLTIVASLIGTQFMPNYKGKILFLEDVNEPLYAIDRNLFQLEKAGVFDKINALILGGFTEIKDTNPSYDHDLETIVKSHFKHRSIPIAFDFPAGHIDDNRALIFGKNAKLNITAEKATIVI